MKRHIALANSHSVYFIDGLFLDAFSVTKLYNFDDSVISEWLIEKDLEDSGHGLIVNYYPVIRLQGLRKATNNLSQDLCLRVEIWSRVLPNTKQEC
jgi:hypothetical protein